MISRGARVPAKPRETWLAAGGNSFDGGGGGGGGYFGGGGGGGGSSFATMFGSGWQPGGGGGGGSSYVPRGATGTDTTGNAKVTISYAVPVDTDLALINVPASIVTDATSASGAIIDYTPPSATDEGGQTPSVTCAPGPGSTFPIGTTTVTCAASATDGDDAASPVAQSFTVTVKGAGDQLAELYTAVQATGPGASLADKVGTIESAFSQGQLALACDGLTGFLNEVRAQSGKKIPLIQSSGLTTAGQRIWAVLSCST